MGSVTAPRRVGNRAKGTIKRLEMCVFDSLTTSDMFHVHPTA